MQSVAAYQTRPLTSFFGVELLDVDLADIDAELGAAIIENFERHGVLLIRGQSLSPQQQLELTALFGEPAPNSRAAYCHPDYPPIYIISNKVVDGRVVGEMNAGYGWHTDMSYSATPALCTILHGVETPAEGSDTLLADMCAAYEALPEERRTAIEGLKVHHSFVSSMAKRSIPITPEQTVKYPDVFHPMVRSHHNGRKSLWAASMANGVPGMPEPEAQALLKEMLDFATQEQFVYRHQWQPGDVLIWDDRRTLHTGTKFDDTKYVRYMQRTWVGGDAPF
ncbi:TauD/TfdA family dioxygenase [soil metagenome]